MRFRPLIKQIARMEPAGLHGWVLREESIKPDVTAWDVMRLVWLFNMPDGQEFAEFFDANPDLHRHFQDRGILSKDTP